MWGAAVAAAGAVLTSAVATVVTATCGYDRIAGACLAPAILVPAIIVGWWWAHRRG